MGATPTIDQLEDEVSYLRQQLTHAESLCEAPKAEQLRATALSLAIEWEVGRAMSTASVIETAEKFEAFLKDGGENG